MTADRITRKISIFLVETPGHTGSDLSLVIMGGDIRVGCLKCRLDEEILEIVVGALVGQLGQTDAFRRELFVKVAEVEAGRRQLAELRGDDGRLWAFTRESLPD